MLVARDYFMLKTAHLIAEGKQKQIQVYVSLFEEFSKKSTHATLYLTLTDVLKNYSWYFDSPDALTMMAVCLKDIMEGEDGEKNKSL